jgi:hypothetical protein
MRVANVIAAMSVVVSTARADGLDDAIARELCGSTPTTDGLVVPNCSVGESAAAAFAGSGDDEQPPTRSLERAASSEGRAPPVLGPDLEHDRRWIGSVGIQLGSAKADGGDLDYVIGVTGAAGIQHDRVSVLGEYTLSGVEYHGPIITSALRVGMPPVGDTDGVMHRLGVVARYAFAKGATAPEVGAVRTIGELWFEAGAGVQRTDWDKGGVLVRPDLVIGLGLTGALRGERRGGIAAAFRVYFARRTDLDDTPTCSAPCTQATPPAAWSDRAYMFDLAYAFGN